jgi:hypothetical protein
MISEALNLISGFALKNESIIFIFIAAFEKKPSEEHLRIVNLAV